MGTGYALAYRLGITPWERAGQAAEESFSRLLAREQADRPTPPGRALDLGCGSGAHTLDLVARGWAATGVDNIDRAVEKARRRPGADAATFVVGDVTALPDSGIEPGVDFFLDVGCFHGLADEERVAYGAGVTALASPRATLLMLAFHNGHRIGLPRGAQEEDLAKALPGWTLLSTDPADTTGMPAPLRRTAPQWFRLRLG